MSFCSVLVKNWGQFFEKLRFFLICDQKQRKQIDSIFRMLSTCRDSFDVYFETFLTFHMMSNSLLRALALKFYVIRHK